MFIRRWTQRTTREEMKCVGCVKRDSVTHLFNAFTVRCAIASHTLRTDAIHHAPRDDTHFQELFAARMTWNEFTSGQSRA